MHPLNEVLLAGRSYDDAQMQRIGAIGVALLKRFVPPWVVSEMIRSHAAGTSLAAVVPREISLEAALVEAMMGGALVSLARTKAVAQAAIENDTRDMMTAGMVSGLAALRRVLDGSAKATAERIRRLESAEAAPTGAG
jgi:hypothetical protein